MPRSPFAGRNPLTLAFDEIDALASTYARGGPPDHTPQVGREEVEDFAGMTPAEPDMHRALQLQRLVAQANDGKGGRLDGNWGSLVNLTDAAAPNPIVPLINLKADDGTAETVTITLGQPTVVKTVHPTTRVTCVVQTGNGGANQQTEVDWVQGASFQVHGSFIRVSARVDFELGAAGPSPTGNQYTVAAYASRRSCARVSELVRSISLATVLHANSANVTIASPPSTAVGMVSKVRAMWNSGATPVTAVSISLRDVNGNVLAVVDLTNDPDQWIPIIGPTANVLFSNNDATHDIAQAYLVFAVEL